MLFFVAVVSFYGTTYGAPTCDDAVIALDSGSAVESTLPQQPAAKNGILGSLWSGLKKTAINNALKVMAITRGLPKYLARNDELQRTGQYLKYKNFGALGLAELGVAVHYDRAKVAGLNTERPLVIVANHPLGIADGLALQYIVGNARTGSPTLLFLARWVEKILPHAVFGDVHGWGTAIPVDISKPEPSDPRYAEVQAFNNTWSRKSIRALKAGGALIIFPAGHVASMNKESGAYPKNVFDAPGSWQEGVLTLARAGRADVVFAHIDSVNSEAFYKNRKRFGGGDRERVVWFMGEALGMREIGINVKLSDPMSVDAMYTALALHFGYKKEALEGDTKLTAELMRQYTYQVGRYHPQELNVTDRPQKISSPD